MAKLLVILFFYRQFLLSKTDIIFVCAYKTLFVYVCIKKLKIYLLLSQMFARNYVTRAENTLNYI